MIYPSLDLHLNKFMQDHIIYKLEFYFITPLSFNPMLSFPEFIRSDNNFAKQRSNILNLMDHTEFLQYLNIQQTPVIKVTKHSFYSYLFTQRDEDISYKLEKLRVKLIDLDDDICMNIKRINKRTKESKRLAWIMILALANKRIGRPVVKMLGEKDFDMDQPAFRMRPLPSYAFLYALLCYDIPLKNYSINQIWSGYSTGILYRVTQKTDLVAVMSTSQYRYISILKSIYRNNMSVADSGFLQESAPSTESGNEKPLFPVDIMIMKRDYAIVTEILRDNTKMVRSSHLCYLLHSDTKFTLELLRYNINVYQNFHGITPLHVAAREGNLELVVIYLELGFGANDQDINGNTPLHYSAMNSHLHCFEYLSKMAHNDIVRYNFDAAHTDVQNISGLTPMDYLTVENNYSYKIDVSFILTLLREARNDALKKFKFKIIKSNSPHSIDKFPVFKEFESKFIEINEAVPFPYEVMSGFINIMQIIHSKVRFKMSNDRCKEILQDFFIFY